MKRLSALVLVIGVALAACGGRGRGSAGLATTPTRAPVAIAAGDFGTLGAVCGPGTAKGATEQSVTDTSIDVGTMGDPGALSSSGPGQELFDTADAFVRWCNAAGGILGRRLILHKHDAKLYEVTARMVDACNQDFALVGDGTTFDKNGLATRLACQLPEVPAYNSSPEAAEAPLKVDGDPSPIQQAPAFGYLGVQHLFLGVDKIGFITADLAGMLVTRDRYKEAAAATGFKTVYNESYPAVGVPGWRAYVQRMKDSGAQVISLTGDYSALVGMERSMKDLSWYPEVVLESANQYDSRVVKEGGDAIQNTWVYGSYYPVEEARSNPPTQQYLDIMTQFVPGGKIAMPGLTAMSAWLLFATAVRDCGSNLTRICLLRRAGGNPAWTAGGLKAPVSTNPADRQSTQCYLAMKATPTAFVRDQSFLPANAGVYNCSPANVVTLRGNYASSG